MLQKEKRAERKVRIAVPIEKSVRAIRADDAFRVYAEKALLRFDLEGTTEAIRQHEEQMSLCEAIGVYTMSDRIRDILEREQEHQVELSIALGDGAPDMKV